MNETQPQDHDLAVLHERLREAEQRLAEVKAERDEARDLNRRMEEQVTESNAVIDRWIEAFDMSLGDDGQWQWAAGLVGKYDDLREKYLAILKDWNKFVPQYNARVAPKEIGRPLDASAAQCKQVMRLRSAGRSLRSIADETNLSFQTVRTIVARASRKDRTTVRRLTRIDIDRADSTRGGAESGPAMPCPR